MQNDTIFRSHSVSHNDYKFSRPVLKVKSPEALETLLLDIKLLNTLEMNFNRRDSLKFDEVLNDPQFVEFLKKWELNRHPSIVDILFNRSKVYLVNLSFLPSFKVLGSFNKLYFDFTKNIFSSHFIICHATIR